jgi:hypothetical protein
MEACWAANLVAAEHITFFFTNFCLLLTLEITEDLGEALQKKSQDILNNTRLVLSTKARLDEIRSVEKSFCSELLSFVQTISVDIF